ncbi:MAG: hypothetical protein UU41_C0019G0009 [Candidatus Roizmanbacteria bacterium GW2011_GWA1_41_13]|uniref:Uncharacterized protein n=1 Tax=Candidatus Roizmanbacteria bacterium GW2011_GWA1_41_13 TaxID=1618474 RepID=A0A0G0Y0B3_9BACT|nr:MAG: hypothetical protein UU41_C0019G0009 [Candidatus Roizmanbacteria bacterium GW2011_GWA1_41_13]
MKMTKVSIETNYKFNIVATKDAVRNAFDNAGLILALRETTGVIRTLCDELVQARQEYKNYVAKTENILSSIKEYRKQDDDERKKIAKDVVEYWFDKVSRPMHPLKNKTVVYFSVDSELYCEPKTPENCYRFEANSGRSKLIQKSIESAVYEMKKIIHEKLNISDFIDGYQDSGYRISPSIILKKD